MVGPGGRGNGGTASDSICGGGGSLARLKPLIVPYANGVLWDPVMRTFLAAPSWAVLGVLGVIFVLLGRKKKPLIGYARP